MYPLTEAALYEKMLVAQGCLMAARGGVRAWGRRP